MPTHKHNGRIRIPRQAPPAHEASRSRRSCHSLPCDSADRVSKRVTLATDSIQTPAAHRSRSTATIQPRYANASSTDILCCSSGKRSPLSLRAWARPTRGSAANMLACPWLSSSAVSMTTNVWCSSSQSSTNRSRHQLGRALVSPRVSCPRSGHSFSHRCLDEPRRDEFHTMDRESSSAEVLHGNSAFDNLSGPHMLRIEHLSEQYLVVFDDTRRQARGSADSFVSMRESRQVEGLYGKWIRDFGRQSLIGDKVIYQELPPRAVTRKVGTRPFVMEPQVNMHRFSLPQEVDLSVVGQAYVSHRRQPLRKALDKRTGGVECLVTRPDGPGPALISGRVTKRLQSGNHLGPCRSRLPYGMDGNRRFLDRMLACAWHPLAHRLPSSCPSLDLNILRQRSVCAIRSGRTHRSYCSPVRWPLATAASRRVMPSRWAVLAMVAALS